MTVAGELSDLLVSELKKLTVGAVIRWLVPLPLRTVKNVFGLLRKWLNIFLDGVRWYEQLTHTVKSYFDSWISWLMGESEEEPEQEV
jgi:DUF1365 family protein